MSTPPEIAFHLFQNLPAELRIRIWHLTLERQRIIKLRLRNRLLMDGLLARQGGTRPQTREEERYGVVADGYQTLSKLFRVSRESRDAALAFYRVHVPCWLVRGSTKEDVMKPGMIYFNPEHDFLYISTDTGQVVEFLHDLKTIYDPRHIGLLNLAIDRNGLTGGFGLCTIGPFTLTPQLKKSFTETLIQLREVFFVQVQRTGRHIFGYRSGAPTSEDLLNLSFPIVTMALNFKRHSADPRQITRDLGKVFVNSDPRAMLFAWGRLFYDYFGGLVIPETEHRVLLTFAPTACDIYDQKDAEEWLRREECTWEKESKQALRSDPDETVESAFGFWLFPVDAFGPLPDSPRDGFTSEAPRFLDLRGYWPELGLTKLP